MILFLKSQFVTHNFIEKKSNLNGTPSKWNQQFDIEMPMGFDDEISWKVPENILLLTII